MKRRREHMHEFIARDPKGFERWQRVFPYANAATVVTYGMFVVISLVALLAGRQHTLSLLKASIVLFALTGFLQTALYLLWRDRAALYLIGTCATMLLAQAVNALLVPRTLGEMLGHILLWSGLMAGSLYLAWKAMQLAKENAELQKRRAADAHSQAMAAHQKLMEKLNGRDEP